MEVKTVLCPVDFSPISLRNLRMAVEVSKRVGARLVIHHNLDVRPPGFLSVAWMWSEDHESDAEQKADEVPAQLEQLFAQIPEGVELSVVDHGPGMDDATLAHLGEPFFTTKKVGEGMGLGIFLMRAVLESIGGQLKFESRVGEGTRVHITLPGGEEGDDGDP